MTYRMGSYVPKELESQVRGAEVHISLNDKRGEEYTPPPKPAYTAFSGEGQAMGSAVVALLRN